MYSTNLVSVTATRGGQRVIEQHWRERDPAARLPYTLIHSKLGVLLEEELAGDVLSCQQECPEYYTLEKIKNKKKSLFQRRILTESTSDQRRNDGVTVVVEEVSQN